MIFCRQSITDAMAISSRYSRITERVHLSRAILKSLPSILTKCLADEASLQGVSESSMTGRRH